MTPSPRQHESDRPGCIDPASSASVSRRPWSNGVINVTHSTLFHDGILGGNCAADIGHSEMCGGEDAGFSLLDGHTGDITTPRYVRFDTDEPESRHGRVQLHESDQDALRVAYGHRQNIVLDSLAPDLAPHIVITPPEKNDYDCYTPWLNATGPQWAGHLVVTMPPNAMDYTLVHGPSPQSSQLRGTGPAHIAKAVFCLSKFRSFVASVMHERAHMANIVDVLQRIHRKAVAFTASEIGRGFLTCEEYACSSEKPFRWTDPAEPFLQRKNQYRGTIVIESPSPFTIPHIIINEPPPQDPWVYWYNATTTQDHGFGQYLTIPHRLVWYTRAPDGAEDYWVTPRLPEEQPDVNWQEDVDSSGSSASESEPETPDPDPMMDDFLILEHGDDLITTEVRGDLDFDIDFFGSCDDSPWSGIINRYSTKIPTFVTSDHKGANPASPAIPAIIPYEEDELPPFDDWYQTVAARAAMTMTA